MKLLYQKNKYFIGVIKFYDTYKNFGFIASNNCGMLVEIPYSQDFYINSESFLEEVLQERTIVVFQVAQQNRFRVKAVNVRCISQSEEDLNLALTYYGEHEFVTIKDDVQLNLFNQIVIPREKMTEMVLLSIIQDKERSPATTLNHFKSFIEHYPTHNSLYIFDSDFFKKERLLWDNFFSTLTKKELLAIFTGYPSVGRYINDDTVIKEWTSSRINQNLDLSELEAVRRHISYLPDNIKSPILVQIKAIADCHINEFFDSLLTDEQLNSANFKIQIQSKLANYALLTNTDFKNRIQQVEDYLRYKEFCYQQQIFLVNEVRNCLTDSLFNSYNNLKGEKISHKDELTRTVESQFRRLISNEKYIDAVYLVDKISEVDEEYADNKIIKLFPLIKKYLLQIVTENLNNNSFIEEYFINTLPKLTSCFSPINKENIHLSLKTLILKTESIYVLNSCCQESIGLLSKEEATTYAIQLIQRWDYETMNGFLTSSIFLFQREANICSSIVEKALNLIFDEIFDNDNEEKLAYIRNIRSIDSNNRAWTKYLESRTTDELISLYKTGIITELPETVIRQWINAITISDFEPKGQKWYKKPVLINKHLHQLFHQNPIDFVRYLVSRLENTTISKDNLLIAIALTELLAYDKPSGNDYYKQKQWNQKFQDRLNHIYNTKNRILNIILGAVYQRTESTIQNLSNIFTDLPPYLQIRNVRYLFKLINRGVLQFNAHQLYFQLTKNGQNQLCLPLEITFEYLKLREGNPKASLNNNMMLNLLNKCDDTEAWNNIQDLFTVCSGRRIIDKQANTQKWRNTYYNGLIENIDNGIQLSIPSRMIDEQGKETKYNNKYSAAIKELIQITFAQTAYKVIKNNIYRFQIKDGTILQNFARYFNLKDNANKFDNNINFKREAENEKKFCECRLSNKADTITKMYFYWCENKPCFRLPLRYRIELEWENYTVLDFMRILKIQTDYENKAGNVTKFGYYIILSSYLNSFKKYYNHLKCRECKRLMKPSNLGNYGYNAVHEFSCQNEACKEYNKMVYINHCFNCNTIIDSRDSKQCPNNQYICPECGSCCSSEVFARRKEHLERTGGFVPQRLINFINYSQGHKEQNKCFCYKCGKPMTIERDRSSDKEIAICRECNVTYPYPIGEKR